MSFQECAAPGEGALAFYSPFLGLKQYLPEVHAQARYWVRQEKTSQDNVELGRHALAQSMQSELIACTAIGTQIGPGMFSVSERELVYKSQCLVSSLAVSRLIRLLWKSDEEIEDGKALLFADAVIDTTDDKNHNPYPGRIHMLTKEINNFMPEPASAEKIDTWYHFRSMLYIQRVRPALPTPHTLQKVLDQDIEVPFKQMDTLIPFLPLRP